MNGRRSSITQLLVLGDICFAAALPFAALGIRNLFDTGAGIEAAFLLYALSSAVCALTMLYGMGCARASWRFYSSGDVLRAARAVALGITIGMLASFAHDRMVCVARVVPLVQAALQVTAFVGTRLFLRSLFGAARDRDPKPNQVLVVGCNDMSLTFMYAVRELLNGTTQVVGLLAEDRDLVGQTIHGKRVLGTIAEVGAVIGTLRVHGVDISTMIFAPGPKGFSKTEICALDAARARSDLTITDVPSALSAYLASQSAPQRDCGSEWAGGKRVNGILKRMIDVTGSALLLFVAAPLMVFVCTLVAVDVGLPVLFWQQRIGKDGRKLTVYKFRTMRAPVDSAGRRIPDAKRVSAVGRLLRKMRIDELPQLISVLIGDMSFVGPRPLLLIDQPLDARRRLAVKPGLTGWAQVHGGNLVTVEEKNALDLWYVAHSSVWLDLQIGIRTILTVFRGDSLNDRKIEQAKHWMNRFELAPGA